MPTTCSPSPTRSRTRPAARSRCYPYALISRHGMPKIEGFYILHEGLIGVLGDERAARSSSYADVLKDGGDQDLQADTAAGSASPTSTGRRRSIPDQKAAYDAKFSGIKQGSQGALPGRLPAGTAVTIPPGGQRPSDQHTCSPAPSRSTLIEAYGEKLGAKQFDLLIDWGWFYFITKPLFKLLHWLSPDARQLRPRDPRHHRAREGSRSSRWPTRATSRWPR